MKISVQTGAFDLAAEVATLYRENPKVGAVCSFLGLVRDINEGQDVSAMTLEHYPGMTEKALADIVEQAQARWQVLDACVIHRVGPLYPTDPIGGSGIGASRRCFCRLRVHNGFPQDPRAVLEKRGNVGRREVGRCA